MINAYVLAGVILGSVLVGLYLFASLRRKNTPNLRDAAVLFLASCGASAGVKLCVMSVSSASLAALNEERAYIFLGGLAVVWISSETIIRVFKAP